MVYCILRGKNLIEYHSFTLSSALWVHTEIILCHVLPQRLKLWNFRIMKSLLVVNKTQLCEIWRFKTACLSLVRRCSAAAHCTAAPVKHGCCVQEKKCRRNKECALPLFWAKVKEPLGECGWKNGRLCKCCARMGPSWNACRWSSKFPSNIYQARGGSKALKKWR